MNFSSIGTINGQLDEIRDFLSNFPPIFKEDFYLFTNILLAKTLFPDIKKIDFSQGRKKIYGIMRLPFNRGGFRSYLILLGILAGRSSIPSVLWGVPLLLIGIALHIWSKGYLHQEKEVTTSGPYRFIRHPFYLGNVFIDLSIVVMSGWKLLIGTFPFYWLAVYIPVMRREEEIMMNLFGEAYRKYARCVPRFFPIRRPLPASGRFSWRSDNILKTEFPRAFRFLSYPFLFLFSHEIRSNGVVFPPNITPLALTSLLIFLLLYGLSWQIKQAASGRNILNSRWFSLASTRIVFLAAFVLFGSLFTYFELEAGESAMILGLLAIVLSLLVHSFKPKEAVLAEFILMIGASILWELPWLCVIPFCLYSVDLILTRLLPLIAKISIQRPALTFIPYGSTGFQVFLIFCVFSGIAKEIVMEML